MACRNAQVSLCEVEESAGLGGLSRLVLWTEAMRAMPEAWFRSFPILYAIDNNRCRFCGEISGSPYVSADRLGNRCGVLCCR